MKKLLLALLLIAAGLGLFAYSAFFSSNPDSPGNREAIIIVPKGGNVASVADSLERHGVITSPLRFSLAGRILGVTKKLRPGGYRIAYGLSNKEIIRRLTGTEYAVFFQATFPEGITMYRVARIAKEKLQLDSARVIEVAQDTALLRELGLPKEAKTAEGYLFPDTYEFFFSVDPRTLVETLVKRWKKVVTDSVVRLGKERNGMSLHELMTFASIIESEARVASERDTIAGVYWNRLKIGMKLDADPTVQYGLKLQRPITHADLLINTPYNTYLNKGLPPGPVNNPGAASIKAALEPVKHDYLYFVTRKDGSGGHYFSRTMDRQNAMITESRKNLARHSSAQ